MFIMTKDEALKMAIEYLDGFKSEDKETTLELTRIISTLKCTLEQPPPNVEPFDVWAGTNPKRTYKNGVHITINVMHKNKLVNLLRIQRNEDKKYYIELNDLIRFINMGNSKKEQQEVGDAEIKQMLDDIEWYQKRVEELEQPAQKPVAWMRSALDNARDVCKYLDHDMVKEAKAHTKFFWNDIEKIKEPDTHFAPQLAQEPAVGFMNKHTGELKKVLFDDEAKNDNDWLDVYTHPAPSWQGLSMTEIYNIADNNGMIFHTHWEQYAHAIEQALKEKNNV